MYFFRKIECLAWALVSQRIEWVCKIFWRASDSFCAWQWDFPWMFHLLYCGHQIGLHYWVDIVTMEGKNRWLWLFSWRYEKFCPQMWPQAVLHDCVDGSRKVIMQRWLLPAGITQNDCIQAIPQRKTAKAINQSCFRLQAFYFLRVVTGGTEKTDRKKKLWIYDAKIKSLQKLPH